MDFKDIKPVSPSGELDEYIEVLNTADLSYVFNNQVNAGDQIEMFFSIAESTPELALKAFSSVVIHLTSSPIKALSIQGFSQIPSPLKQALSSCVAQESQELLKVLCNEIKKCNNDLIVWSAAKTLREMKFSPENIQHPEGGNLAEPVRRIQNEVLDRKIQEISRVRRLDSRGDFTADYERYLEFWIYGPMAELFNEKNSSQTYIDIVRDVLQITQIRGVQFGLNAENERVREESFNQLKLIFKEFSKAENKQKKKFIIGLKRFLKEPDSNKSGLDEISKALQFIFRQDMNPQNLALEKLKIIQIKEKVSLLEEYKLRISRLFLSASRLSGEIYLTKFLETDEDRYINSVNNWIDILNGKVKKILELSLLQQFNKILLSSTLQSIRNDDESIYQRINGEIYLDMSRLNSSISETQEENNEILTQLNIVKNKLSSLLSREINEIEGDIRRTEKSIAEDRQEANSMLINTGVAFIIAVLAPVIAALFVVIVLLIVVGAGAG